MLRSRIVDSLPGFGVEGGELCGAVQDDGDDNERKDDSVDRIADRRVAIQNNFVDKG